MTTATQQRGDDARDRLWPHFCAEEREVMWTGAGEPCNWCGERQRIVCDEPAE